VGAGSRACPHGAEIVTRTLQRYAERGVFRGFSVTPGRLEYRFSWLTRRPMTLRFDPRTGVLSFRRLFPGVTTRAGMVADLHAAVAGRANRELPAHKRLDRRRVTLTSSVRDGHWSLMTTIRGANHEYAIRQTLNLVNELFLLLHETYPEYLVDHFGLSTE
jgi:hypothetical protein